MNKPGDRFIDIVSAPDEDINLAEAALLIAAPEYPGLDVGTCLEQFDRMAEEISVRLEGDQGLPQVLQEMNRLLFVDEGFTGNEENFIDPRNSFLNEVLERKLGIPITLAIIYIEVGRRLGLPLEGVAFPGHFLVKLSLEQGDLVIDPYAGGATLTRDDLEMRLAALFDMVPDEATFAGFLQAVGNKEILARMLRNLKSIYLKSGDSERALAAVDRLLLLTPNAASEIRDRGRMYQDLDCFQAALGDYRRYLEMEPDAEDMLDIRERAIQMQQASERMH